MSIKQIFSRRGRKRLLSPVNWSNLRSVDPVSRRFGFDRGTPVDRHYIERFLGDHSADIQGKVLEIGDAQYTRDFGGARVRVSEVLHARAGNPAATLVGDLSSGEGIPQETFDCFILTQTLHTIRDFSAALKHARAALRPGGVVLATLPGISPISRYDMDRWGDYWRFTNLSATVSFAQVFGPAHVAVRSYGNLLAATAFLHGISAEDLQSEELHFQDPDFEVTIAVRAVRDA